MGLITPTLPTSGQDRGTEEIDVLNTLTALLGLVNGQLDTANLKAAAGILATQLESNARPSTVQGPYKTIFDVDGRAFDFNNGTNLQFFSGDGLTTSGVAMSLGASGLIVPSSNPWTLSGLTPKLRVVGGVGWNNNAPATTSLTFSLRPATFAGTSGNLTVTAGAAVGSVAVVPVQANFASGASADFNVPAAGFYLLCVQAAVAAAVSDQAIVSGRVELHHV